MDFEIVFTDLTLLQANGKYNKVCTIMNSEMQSDLLSVEKKLRKTKISVSKPPSTSKWMLRSEVSIKSLFGYANLTCHFYSTGKIYVARYFPSVRDIHNTDIRCLTHWANEYGWKVPEPLNHIVDEWPAFWRNEWETYIIDSAYLEKKYGPRKDMQFDDTIDQKDATTDQEEGDDPLLS